ncbi:hydrolase [Paenibacillus harenae]|uniref:Nicotinamidase-related amidase n=2 Tax=Paenibacillus harenae TaxID=306543 RepID=A0ABT9U4Q8_PAEHA|nr:nicotinamidase-related amidase [Paenibacillus harenae]
MKKIISSRITTLALLTAVVSTSAFGSILIAKAETVGASSPAIQAKAVPSSKLLTPTNHTLLMIDHQPQMAFGTSSIDIQVLRNNVTGLAKAAKAFKVPTVLTTVAAESFSGPIFPEIQAVFPEQQPIDRTTMNAWEDQRVVDKVNSYGKKKLVVSGLWTEVCDLSAVLSAIDQGYEVYIVTDTSGGVTEEAHDMAIERMIQAGAAPITWEQYLLELQRDWARSETYKATTDIAKEHGGAYGLGIIYSQEMFGGSEGH